jgi:7-carboxy-7-deazaguanine synthase
MFELVERYLTLAGEAPLSGRPVYIVRFSGCNLNCFYCDTTYHNEKNEILSGRQLERAVADQLSQYPGSTVLFTGGEPLLGNRHKDLVTLINNLPDIECYIETNGSLPICHDAPPNCHYIADWKTPSSGEGNSFLYDNIERFITERDCIKFVVNRDDLPWLLMRVQQVKRLKPDLPLYVSPQWGKVPLQELADFIIRHRLNLNLSLQIHKMIWSPQSRGV